MSEALIYHVCEAAAWRAAQGAGAYTGSADDLRDGFMHFSTFAQVRTSVAIHRAGQAGLVMLVVAADKLGPALKWEPSRGGQLFPHLYGDLPMDAVVEAIDLSLDGNGMHQFPDGYPGLED
jgi:uncharacterized protein (DUF952 family)